MHATHLECSACATEHAADRVQTTCTQCGATLLHRYDLDALRGELTREDLETGPRNIWRFAPMLPVVSPGHRYTLGEGLTPMLPITGLPGAQLSPQVFLKQEGLNPTGTFKARGLSVAVSRAVELGVDRFVIPTAGNAGVALAAYCALAGAEATVFVPEDAPNRVIENPRRLGAEVVTVKGTIADAGAAARAWMEENPDALDVSTMREPYRIEGKKTMGIEVAVDLDWNLPDVIVYPTGGGTGLVGMAKAFQELHDLGLVDATEPPRLVAVQSEGCAPVVKAMREGAETCEAWPEPATHAAGLRVPKPFADRLVLAALRDTGGDAVAVSEKDIERGVADLARLGVLASPEGGAALAGCRQLVDAGRIRRGERVVVFNTGSALAY